jgi:hypothetical protein
MFTLMTIMFLVLVSHNFVTEKRLRALEKRIHQLEQS